MAADSRSKMVRSAASLIASHGVTATSFADVVADSGAPRGSIYHHFPEGKRQLAAAAVELTSTWVLSQQRQCPGQTPGEVLDCFVDLWRQVVMASNGSAGCAVAGVAVDTGPDDRELMEPVRATFQAWVDLLAEQLAAAGVAGDRARPIALATVAAMEGALILCRAQADGRPLDIVAAELHRLLPTAGGARA
jgi:TetR/AcrR family transcriptional repressor of lmrAB and yxaGH operons